MTIIDGKDAATRKAHPVFSGVLRYFPDAICAVAELSRIGNDQHNPGQPLHWSRHKSSDHGDCLVRHQLDAGGVDVDGVRHATKVAWRALAQLQLEIEADAADPIAELDAFECESRFKPGDRVRHIEDGCIGVVTSASGAAVKALWAVDGTWVSLTYDDEDIMVERREGPACRRKVCDLGQADKHRRRTLGRGRRNTDTVAYDSLPFPTMKLL